MRQYAITALILIFVFTLTSPAQAFWGKKKTKETPATPKFPTSEQMMGDFEVKMDQKIAQVSEAAVEKYEETLETAKAELPVHPLEPIFKLLDAKTSATLKETIRLLGERNLEETVNLKAFEELIASALKEKLLTREGDVPTAVFGKSEEMSLDETLAHFITDVLGRNDALIKGAIREIHLNEDEPQMDDPIEWQKFRVTEIKRLQAGRQKFLDLLNTALERFNQTLV